MKGSSSLFVNIRHSIASGDISFMGNLGKRSDFARYIALRPDIDPNGMFDIIAHGNSDRIEIVNGNKPVIINSRVAAKIIKNKPNFKSCKAIRLFSCNTGSTKNGFAQNLANALGKPVYAPNMTITANDRGSYWISDKGKKGEFIKFVPGGNRDGKN